MNVPSPADLGRRTQKDVTPLVLTREKLEGDWLRRFAAQQSPDMPLLTDAELEASLEATLAVQPEPGPVWLFGYASLLWNPCIHVAERRTGRVFGKRRALCLWTPIGRGTAKRPGLVMGLERGGSCYGVALGVAPELARNELRLVWRREMLSGAYLPTWVRLKTDGGTLWAIAFVMNPAHPRYAGKVPDEVVVETVAYAKGGLGSCFDYVASTLAHLQELGIRDPHLVKLCRAAAALRDQAPLADAAD